MLIHTVLANEEYFPTSPSYFNNAEFNNDMSKYVYICLKFTRETIGVMRTICERSLEHGNEVFICFVDFEKAFDRINWVKMLQILKSIGLERQKIDYEPIYESKD